MKLPFNFLAGEGGGIFFFLILSPDIIDKNILI